MDIKIIDSWLREYIDTKLAPNKLAELLSLSGPSVERVEKHGSEIVYSIEVTSNRVDSASVYGIAREAVAILLQNNIHAKTRLPNVAKNIPSKNPKLNVPLNIKTNKDLTHRVMGVVIDVVNDKSPEWLKNRLELSGVRSLNTVVDITNYVMLEIGHPTHVFDYDRIDGGILNIREAKKGEQFTSLDGKVHNLVAGDIVIEDKNHKIIDLPGIMGAKNSVVTPTTKRILFFLETNNALKIRKTSMRLGIRTMAAVLNEKGVDSQLATLAFNRGIELYKTLAKGQLVSKIVDIYPKQIQAKAIIVTHEQIESLLGISIPTKTVKQILQSLGFHITENKNSYSVVPPTWRSRDIAIPEDICEEVARIYGYHNLPSVLMSGALPQKPLNQPFAFETKVKQILRALGAIEIYSSSLVSKQMAPHGLEIDNPLGSDTQYMRTSLTPSLIQVAKQNTSAQEGFHLFEMANVYIPQKHELPVENITLAGIFSGIDYRVAKGIIETLCSELNTKYQITLAPSENKLYWSYECKLEDLYSESKAYKTYTPVPKYPAHIEDITMVFAKSIKLGHVQADILKLHSNIQEVELVDIYKDAYTFRIHYQDPKRTLTNSQVTTIREKIIAMVSKKYGALIK